MNTRPPHFALRTLCFVPRNFSAALALLAAASLVAATNSAPPDAIAPLRPPRAEIPPGFWEQYGFWIIILGMLLVGIALAALWFVTRPRPPVVVPPEVQARQALGALRPTPEDGALLSQVSQIVRHYVAAAFHLPPGELTTSEFCRTIAGCEQIDSELSAAFADFLRQCDQRKFAPSQPRSPLAAVSWALKLIDEAEARRATLAQPADRPAGSQTSSSPGAAK